MLRVSQDLRVLEGDLIQNLRVRLLGYIKVVKACRTINYTFRVVGSGYVAGVTMSAIESGSALLVLRCQLKIII